MIDTPHYPVEVAWSEPDRLYVANVPDLRGCSARGTTRAAAISALSDAIDLWIEQAEILGLALPAPTSPPAASVASAAVVRPVVRLRPLHSLDAAA